MDTQPQRTPAANGAGPARAPAAARLLDYFAGGAAVAVMPGGMALAVQADHVAEVVRLEDLRRGRR